MFLMKLIGQVNYTNAIDVESFSEKDRLDLRTELGGMDCKVIGNVGRLDIQNQPF